MSFSDLSLGSWFHLILFLFLAASCVRDGVKGGKLYFAIIQKGKEKGGKLFWSNLYSFWITDPFAAKIHQENCFSQARVIFFIYISNKNK